MGAGISNRATYYNISNGKICRQLQSPSKTSVSRENANKRTVHEEFYDFLEGYITDIRSKDSEYGKRWLITMKDEDGEYILQMPYSSGYSQAFLKVLPNADFDLKFKITPKLTVEGEKKKTALFVNQDGKALKHFYTKDNPNGMPSLKKVKIKGKEQWDDSEIMEFLEAMVQRDIVPQLKRPSGTVTDSFGNDQDTDEPPF